MNLNKKYMILCAGRDGTRRTEIAHLMAGGAAYLSTLSEYNEDPTVNVNMSHHTNIIVISALDYYEDKGKWSYDHSLLKIAVDNAIRRANIAMQNGINMVIIEDCMANVWDAEPYINMANIYGYEIIAISTIDVRDNVSNHRRSYGKRTLPDDIHSATKHPNWTLTAEHGDIVNIDVPMKINPYRGELNISMGGQESSDTPPNENHIVVLDIKDRHSAQAMGRASRFIHKVSNNITIHDAEVITASLVAMLDDGITSGVTIYVNANIPIKDIVARAKASGLTISV